MDFSRHAESGKKKNFGLTRKQLSDRFLKKRDSRDCSHKRKEELLMVKPRTAIEKLRRSVKNGFIAKYVLADKWFFGKEFIREDRNIKDGAIYIVTLRK